MIIDTGVPSFGDGAASVAEGWWGVKGGLAQGFWLFPRSRRSSRSAEFVGEKWRGVTAVPDAG